MSASPIPIPPISLPQILLAATILTAVYGSYIALSPPPENDSSPTKAAPATRDTLRSGLATSRHFTKFSMAPFIFLAIHTSLLVLYYPAIPASVLFPSGTPDGLNPSLITWSPSTILPLFVIFFVGIPLRLNSYSALGKNFTFTLAEPDKLVTSGMYRYVQHPSYTGIAALVVGNLALLARTDGAASLWLGDSGLLRRVYVLGWGFLLCALVLGFWKRVLEEERMLKGKFGDEWMRWNRKTARFVPGLI
ncbi:hypothetical protein V8F20_005995 [Naviculisporaceae sp. PSN 640]